MRLCGNFGEILNSVPTAFHQKRIHGSGEILIYVAQPRNSLTRRRWQIAPGRQNSITLLAVRLLYESLENTWAGSGKAPGLRNPPPEARRRIPEQNLAISRFSRLGSFLLVTEPDLGTAPDFLISYRLS